LAQVNQIEFSCCEFQINKNYDAQMDDAN
jgi:hypothetical protein